ncbi:MAG: N-ethylmaleimide reductase, partial [Alphaproteobacteria bacterium]|nr:N-ethylmaleimide reductase [Alphaproteobacteria bacterium]
MAPLTRMRAGSIDHVPTQLQADYYVQRASAGLIIAEATAISPEGFGWADTAGLWSAEQVRGWARVTDAVHAA